MAEESYTYSQAKTRLDDIVAQVRKKDVSLEKSLDLLEEGVRLANQCTELIDQAEWESLVTPEDGSNEDGDQAAIDETEVVSEVDGDVADAGSADAAVLPAQEDASNDTYSAGV